MNKSLNLFLTACLVLLAGCSTPTPTSQPTTPPTLSPVPSTPTIEAPTPPWHPPPRSSQWEGWDDRL